MDWTSFGSETGEESPLQLPAPTLLGELDQSSADRLGEDCGTQGLNFSPLGINTLSDVVYIVAQTLC